ncbi:hypothetical protein SO802_022337 [Lithocarpus litseifolius]|uniref:DUF659 domain-containing protein n=1 Tax=Lithocarpus litseifolius TaxID=425828 RepID=A0AAW2CHG2_9ROSI
MSGCERAVNFLLPSRALFILLLSIGFVSICMLLEIKYHLAGVKGHPIDICTSVPEDVKKEAYLAIGGINKKLKSASSSSNAKESKTTSCSISKDLCQATNSKMCASFICFVQGVADYGPEYKLPSNLTLQRKLIPNLMVKVEEYIRRIKNFWSVTGCTLMSSIWSDVDQRAFINVSAYSPSGEIFLKSFEVSKAKITTLYIKDIISSVIDEIGSDKVVQLIIDNTTNFESTRDMLIGKYPRFYITRCAAYGIQMLLKDICEEVDWVKKILRDAKSIVSYMYKDSIILSLMGEYTNHKELKHPCTSRFSSNFLMLRSILNVQEELQLLVASSKWKKLNHNEKGTSEMVASIIQSTEFWSQGKEVLLVLEPLVRVLRLVDSDWSTTGYLYEAMEMEKEAIKQQCASNQDKYMQIWELVNCRHTENIIHPIHAAATFLNPSNMCSEKFVESSEIKDGISFILENLVGIEEREDFMKQVQLYRHKEYDGISVENVFLSYKSIIRILSQPCSSSLCKHNWNAYEVTQTKTNMLTSKMLDNLVYVRMNSMMMKKFDTRESRNLEPIYLDKLNELHEYDDDENFGMLIHSVE